MLVPVLYLAMLWYSIMEEAVCECVGVSVRHVLRIKERVGLSKLGFLSCV